MYDTGLPYSSVYLSRIPALLPPFHEWRKDANASARSQVTSERVDDKGCYI